MIKKLRVKFMLVTLGVLIAVFVAMLIAINVSVTRDSKQQTEALLEGIVASDGIEKLDFKVPKEDFNNQDMSPPENGGHGNPFSANPGKNDEMNGKGMGTFFYVKTDSEYTITESFYDMMLAYDDSDIEYYVDLAVSSGKKRGSIENLEYLIGEKDYGYIIVYAERSVEQRILSSLMSVTVLVAIVTCIIAAVFTLVLSRWMVRPVETALERQKRFISDASHELKTPITIIAANSDVLENTIGTNRQLDNIRSQTERMSGLVHDLLDLTRTEDYKENIVFSNFDISTAILNTTLEFESRVFEEGRTIEYDVQEGIEYNGSEGKIKQLLTILIDNAIKHSDKHGRIDVTLKRQNQKVVISVSNTGAGIPEAEREKVFERFYRSDASRSRETGGYGLGLAIAKSIVDLHKGKITAGGTVGECTVFTVQL